MTELEQFQQLKEKILWEYRKHYPFFQGNWKNFSSQDIQNLIDLIEKNQKQTVSEKWIYTHLKPEINSKLPRKDMLDIFSRFTGYSGWDEFIFEKKENVETKEEENKKTRRNKGWVIFFLLAGGLGVVCMGCYIVYANKKNKINTLELKDAYTQEKIESKDVKAYKEENNQTEPLEIKNSEIQVENSEDKNTKIIIESPYYQKKTVLINPDGKDGKEQKTKIELKPDDYAMVLKAFMQSDIKDWQTRKEQLGKILSEDLEVIVMLKNNLGSEYFNKKEFSEKLIVPTESVKKMKVVEIQNDENNKIKFIRIKQE